MEEFGWIWHRWGDLSHSFCGCHYQNFLERPERKKCLFYFYIKYRHM